MRHPDSFLRMGNGSASSQKGRSKKFRQREAQLKRSAMLRVFGGLRGVLMTGSIILLILPQRSCPFPFQERTSATFQNSIRVRAKEHIVGLKCCLAENMFSLLWVIREIRIRTRTQLSWSNPWRTVN